MTFSVNNRLVLEEYIKTAIEPKRQSGIATPGQREGVKGLRVLMNARLSDGREIPKGALAYIKEEVLHNHFNTVFKLFTCDTLAGKFMLVDLQYIEFFEYPEDRPAA